MFNVSLKLVYSRFWSSDYEAGLLCVKLRIVDGSCGTHGTQFINGRHFRVLSSMGQSGLETNIFPIFKSSLWLLWQISGSCFLTLQLLC
jgi:hypothetical protein